MNEVKMGDLEGISTKRHKRPTLDARMRARGWTEEGALALGFFGGLVICAGALFGLISLAEPSPAPTVPITHQETK